MRGINQRSSLLSEWHARCLYKLNSLRPENEVITHVSLWRDVFEDRFKMFFYDWLGAKHDALYLNPAADQKLRPDIALQFQLNPQGFDFLITEIALAAVEAGNEHKDKDKVLGIMRIALEKAMTLAWRSKGDNELLKYLKVSDSEVYDMNLRSSLPTLGLRGDINQ